MIIRTTAGRAAYVAPLILLPWTFFPMFARFCVRPDFFATLVFQLMLWTWMVDLPARIKKCAGLALLVLWSNLHAGTAPFGILFYCSAILFADAGKLPERAIWILAGALSWFATPIGAHIIPAILELGVRYDPAQTRNADYVSFSIGLIREGEWIYALWPPYCLAALGSYVWLLLKKPSALPALYRKRLLIAWLGLILTALAFWRIRTIHYQILFLLPILASGISAIFESKKGRWTLGTAVCAFGIFLWLGLIPHFIKQTAGMHERGVADWRFPVQSVAFIKAVSPAGKILNFCDFGGYLIAELPEYPVFCDSRETPFGAARGELNAAFLKPERYREFLQKLGVGVVLDRYPRPVLDRRTGTYTDTDLINYPVQDWALVYFDTVSVVLLRRTEQNLPIIREHEYHFLRPGMPSIGGAEWETEADRCLRENPRNSYCLRVKLAFAESRGESEQATRLRSLGRAADPESAW
jgi:hypothetical protein